MPHLLQRRTASLQVQGSVQTCSNLPESPRQPDHPPLIRRTQQPVSGALPARMSAAEKKVVKLISAEGFEFVVDYDAACVSNTIKNMLNSQGGRHAGCTEAARTARKPWPSPAACPPAHPARRRRCLAPAGSFIENEQGEIRFPEITTPVMEVVCKYFYYKVRQSQGRV